MTHVWSQLEGVSLAGQYGLQQRLGGDDAGVWFVTSRTPAGTPALAKLVPCAPSAVGGQLALWQRTALLSHPHLLALLDCGRADVDGESFLFAIFEYPDDRLATAVADGPLTETEARDVLAAVLDALCYLHGQGLVHTAVDPDHVVAVGDCIKLASDPLVESGDCGATPADDVRALGEMLHRLLTGQPVAPGGRPDPTGVNEPFRAIIRHACEPDPNARWTLPQIAAALREANPLLEEAAAVPVEAPAPPARRPKPFPRWIYALYMVLVIAAIFLVRHNSAPARAPAATAPPPAVPAVPPATPSVTRPAAEVPAPVASPARRPESAGAPDPHQSRNWRVIAFTYATESAADKKARQVNTKWPAFHAEVFSPKGRAGFYLVALGGRLTREDAARLQGRARAAGLPRDTYIQNYAE